MYCANWWQRSEPERRSPNRRGNPTPTGTPTPNRSSALQWVGWTKISIPFLHPLDEDFWEQFWKLYQQQRELAPES
jgi:hypothetical protein